MGISASKTCVLVCLMIGVGGCSDVNFSSQEEQPTNSKNNTPPPSDLSQPAIIINNNDTYTRAELVNLDITIPDEATDIYLTHTSDCSTGGNWDPAVKSRRWVLEQKNTLAKLYMKYKTASGAESDCVSDDIIHDDTPPQAMFVRKPSVVNNQTSAQFEFIAQDTNGIDKYFCKSQALDLFQNCPKNYSLNNLGEATHELWLRASDPAGNVSEPISHEWLVDLTPPVVIYNKVPQKLTNDPNAEFAFTATDNGGAGLDKVQCSTSAGQYKDCQSPTTYTATDGTQDYMVRARDKAGNVSLPAIHLWTVDTVGPVITFLKSPTAQSALKDDSLEYQVTDLVSGVDKINCFKDKAPMACAKFKDTLTLNQLTDGDHEFSMTATDKAGNSSSKGHKWLVDTMPPLITFISTPEAISTKKDDMIDYSVVDLGTGVDSVQCSLDGKALTCDDMGPEMLTGLTFGNHVFAVKALDKVGNMAEDSYMWKVQEEIPFCKELPDQKIVGQCLVLQDSFEREKVLETPKPGFGWQKIIDDTGGGAGFQVDANIYNEVTMGPTPEAITDKSKDQKRALYFAGRPGGSVHYLYLISETINLKEFDTLKMSFSYLAIDLEEWAWNKKAGLEELKLEICNAAVNDCTANKNALNSNNWLSIYETPAFAGMGLNGHNHVLNDWQDVEVNIDLNQYAATVKENFVFRFSVILDEGFTQFSGGDPIPSSFMKDGVALDNVQALATKKSTRVLATAEPASKGK